MAVRDYQSSYEAFMAMPESEWMALLGSLFRGGILEPEEQRAFEVAMADRQKPEMHAVYESDEETGLKGHPDGNGEKW